MGFIEWNAELELGIKKVDIQHRKLIQIINELNDAMHDGHGREKVAETLKELYLYTLCHFQEEEAQFSAVPYRDIEGHKKQHAFFVEKLAALQKKCDEDPTAVSLEVMDFLKSWLVHHIRTVDMSYRGLF
jgi:hemerythrin-like metal-binding protein